jgi:hypothetical protein
MKEIVFERSFASHLKSKFWSELNKLKPNEVYKGSDKKYFFNCNQCNHTFDCSLNNIVNNRWCPYCSNPPQKLCENNDCLECFNKSFASHPKSQFWSNKNICKPREIFKSSAKKFWFHCIKCNHSFQIQLDTVNNNKWCIYCANLKLCNNTNCKKCFKNSFASHNKSIYWSDKNELLPRNVFISTNKKFLFNCDKCKSEFEAKLGNIVCGNTWCPFCKNKTEGILNEWLIGNFKNVIYQPRFEWCKDKRKLPFDFLLEEFKLIIELDGIQHFEQVSNWKSPEETLIVDKFKMECALENGYSLIRIRQDEVWNNKIDWQNILINSIKLYEYPQIILHY